MPELLRPLGEAPENLGAVEFAAQLGKLLILWHAPLAGGDCPITVADRDYADLVGTSLRPDLGAPLLRIAEI